MANNPIKTLTDLEAYFKAGGTVTLDGSFLPASATTLIRTELLRTEQNIILSATGADVSLSTDGSTLTVTGTTLPAAAADSFLNLTSMTVDLMFQQPIVGNQPQFTLILRVTMGNGWTLGESFAVIAGMDTDSLPVVNSPYYYFSTFSTPQPAPPFDSSPLASGNILQTGLNYYANIGYTGLFSLVNQILSAQLPTSIAIYGLITQTPSGPVFDLQAPFLNYTAPIKFGFIDVTTPWLGASVSYVALSDDNAVTPCTANANDCIPQLMLYIGTQIQLGSTPPLDIKAGMVGVDNGSGSVAPSETFTLSITPATPQGFGLGDIVSLTQIPVPSEALQYLNTVQLNAFNAGFSLNSSPALQYVQVLVGTDPYSFGPHLMAQFTLNWTQQFFSTSSSTSLVTFTAIFTLPEYPGMQFDIIVNLSPTVTITGVQSGPPVQLSLASMFPGVPNPGGLLEVEFSDFTISINPSQNQYSVGAVIGADFRLFGTDLLRLKDMAIQLELDKSSGNTQYTATFDGIVGLGPIDFAVNATFSNTTDCVLQLHLVNETLGTMINHLVHLVLPDYDVTFPSPWDKLADISLDALMLEVNITKGSVTLTYPTKIDLVFLDITGITLTYQKQQTQSSSVQINIDGTFLGQSISESNPVGWDVINGQPPSVPGGGSSTFDLEYLGLGQHITFTDLDKLTTVELVMAALRNSVYPIGGGTQPTWGVNGLAFSSASNWLIGAQFSLLQTVSLSVIFNDPNLYGLLIQLSGAKAKIFAGLSFEILYRKVSDTIGVYHIELKLPDAIRNLQFGEVSVTLPVVILDIYTNGNFRIDMGFPKGLDFSQSFSLQIFPFVGYGGFYFALLNGQTSSRVPQITNGEFNPVIEFGIALSVGVGKTIDEGILSGGVTVTVVGVLQGVVAWFHPSASNVPEDQYYWVQGTISIVGKLYATIDFAVIKATLSVTAYATATLTVQAYAPIYISISAGVSVEVSVKVVFFTIHLKFSATVSASFTIGHASPTPWIVAAGGSGRMLTAANAPAMLRSHTPHIAGLAMVLRAQRASTRMLTDSPLNWNPVAVFSSPQSVPANVFLSYTKSETTPGGVNAVFLQTISNSVNPNAQTAEQARIPFGPDPAAAGFNVLSEAMLRWAIAAVDGPNATTVTSDNLAYLKAALDQDGALASIMDYDSQLSPFLKLNVTMNVTAAQSTGSVVSGTLLSVCPSLTVNGNSFLQPAIIDPPTQAKIDAYFELLQAQFEASQQQSTAALTAAPMKSVAQIMFEQYCGMVMKSAVQSAVRILAEYPYSAQGPFSINALQTALGDTSITASQLVNPNQKTAGILNPGATLQLSAILYPARQGDSFNSVAAAFNSAGVTNLQGQPLSFTDLTQQNLTTPALFSSGNSVTFTGISYTTQTGDSLNLIAARQLLRAAPVSVLQQINGLLPAETAIQAANTGVSQPIPAGTTIQIPASVSSLGAYVTVAGDSWPLIAAYALALQSQVVAYSTYAAATLALNPNLPVKDPTQPQPAGTPVALAPIPRILQPGDTIQSLAQTLVSAATTPIESSLAAAPVLSPHAQIFMPALLYKVSSADSFQGIAQKFNTTLDQIAGEIDPSANLFSGAALTVADLSQVTISTLVSTLLDAGEWNMNAGMVSRFLMAGLRLPNPQDAYFQSLTVEQLLDPVNLAKVVTVPMYGLTGQQFPIASPPPAGYQVTVANPDTTAPWLTVGTTGTLQFGLTQDEITFIAQLAQPMPDLELLNLTRLALYNLAPQRFGLQQHLTWQPAVPPSSISCMSTAQAAGSPSVWMFPDPMIQALDALPPSPLPYELVAGTQESATSPMTISDVNCYGWGTLVNLQIQLPPPDQTSNPNTYVIAGSDATGQDLLQSVYQHLTTTKDKATIYILYPPNPVATFPSGLLSDQLDPDLSFVLKTNLSTLTQAPAGLMAELYATPPPQTPYSAALGDAANFLNLTWEAGAVGGGGFYLIYVNANGGGSLPGHLFGAGGRAGIYLLIVVTNSTGGSQPLYSFNNCAIVGDNLDPGSVNLFAQPVVAVAQTTDTLDTIADAHNTAWGTTLQASDLGVLNQDNALMLQVGAQLSINGSPYTIAYGDTLSSIAAANNTNVAALVNMTNGGGTNGAAAILAAGALLQFTTGVLLPVASVPAGITGFELTRTNPDPQNLPFSQLSADDRIRLLYQMMGFSIAASANYVASGAGLPAGPTVSNQDGGDGLTANSAASVPEEWNYQHTLSVAPFAVTANGSLSAALPPAADNPFNGVGQGDVTLNFALSDVYGNTQPLPSGYQSLGIPVGYTDQLTGIGQWPSAAAGYQVTGAAGSPSLEIDTSMQLDRYIATASNSLAGAQQAAKGDAAAYQTIYYQLTQPDVSLYLQTTLDANSLTSTTPVYPIDKNAMLGFAESAWLYLTAVQSLQQQIYSTGSSDTLTSVTGTFGVSGQALLEANSALAYASVFGAASLQVPAIHFTTTSDSLSSIGAPVQLTPSQIAERNTSAPLVASLDLSIPTWTYNVPANLSLLQAALNARCTVDGIANANHGIPNLLQTGFVMTVSGVSIPVAGGDSFDGMVTKFQNAGVNVTLTELAEAVQAQPGIFVTNAPLTIADVLTRQGDTLATIAQANSITVDQIATANAQFTGLFPPGTPIVTTISPVAPESGATLGSYASANGVTLAELASQNGPADFVQGAPLAIPGLASWPTPTSYSTYLATGSETLGGIAGKFANQTAATIAALNSDRGGLFALNQSVSYGGKSTSTSAASTFNSLVSALEAQGVQVTVAELASSLAAQAGLIANGGVWITSLMNAGDGASNTLSGLCSKYNLDLGLLATANSCLQGFLASGAPVAFGGQTVTTQSGDTLQSLIYRFSLLGVQADVNSIAAAAATVPALLNAASPVIPPPQIISTSVSITPKLTAAVTPLTVEIVETRNPKWVDPDFTSSPAVATSITSLSPSAENAAGEPLSLQTFAADLETALPGLHVATGSAISESDPDTSRRVWVVNFGNSAGPAVAYAFDWSSTRSFAVPPLSTSLMSGTVDLATYTSGQGMSSQTQPKTLQSVDLDVWASQFLTAVDEFLYPGSAAGAFNLAPLTLSNIIAQKESLAETISGSLIPILSNQTQDGLPDAQTALKQALRTRLSSAYTVSSLVQTPVTVTNPQSALLLSGKPTIQAVTGAEVNDLTLTTAKVDLSQSGSDATFLLSVKSPASTRNVTLTLDYAANQLEMVQGQSGDYPVSDWLAFVNPLGTANSSNTSFNVPLPLRAYPSPISLVAQSSTSGNALPPANLVTWDYTFTYEHLYAAQDTTTLQIVFNSISDQPPKLPTAGINLASLFQALAQFISVYPALKNDLVTLPQLNPGEVNQTAQVAVTTFDTLVQTVAQAWAAPPPRLDRLGLTAPGLPPIVYNYQMELTENNDGTLNQLVLTSSAANPVWPGISVNVNGTMQPLSPNTPSGGQAVYNYPAGIPIASSLQQQFTFPGQSMVTAQDGWAGVAITRNGNLLNDPPQPPDAAPAFIYQTPMVGFPTKSIPLIVNTNAIDIRSSGNLAEDLGAFFAGVLGTASGYSYPIRTACSYGYQLAGQSQGAGLSSLLPVVLVPQYPFDPSTDSDSTNPNSFVSKLESYLTQWQKDNQPAATNGAFYFDISLYSIADPQNLVPLTEATSVQFPLS
ncbi:MAG: LysM peptidoglycan-binding domain-containing protein [Bryobacterales bacterium]|nr:LysM peptidoglycan-binding domain-containing protein [Bryobacterales bacterium]